MAQPAAVPSKLASFFSSLRAKLSTAASSSASAVAPAFASAGGAAPGAAGGVSAPPLDVSPLVRDVLARHRVPGLAGAIVELRTQGASALGVAGLRRAGCEDQPLQLGDSVHLGSDTKAMTATLIGQLLASGELQLQSTVGEVWPALAPKMHPFMAQVTVAQLLAHRAGVPANVNWWAYARGAGKGVGLAGRGGALPAVVSQRMRIVEDVLSQAPVSSPGSAYLYSNVGYMLLGAIIETRGQCSWEHAISQRLFTPLGMRTAGFGPPQEAWGHKCSGQGAPYQAVQEDNAEPLGPAGRVHCSLADWARYVAWVLRAHREDTSVLPSAVHKLLLTPSHSGEPQYAGGWLLVRRSWAGGLTLTHAGSNTTWYCVAWLAPGKEYAVLAVTNAGGDEAEKACDDLAAALIRTRK